MVSLQVLPSSQLIFPSKLNLVFWNLFEFSAGEITQNQYLPHFESKSCQINSIKSCSSKSFQQHQRHIPIPWKYLVAKKSFNIQDFWHCKSKRHGTKPMHPFSSRAFQRDNEHNLKHPSSVDLITTKQTTFLHK